MGYTTILLKVMDDLPYGWTNHGTGLTITNLPVQILS